MCTFSNYHHIESDISCKTFTKHFPVIPCACSCSLFLFSRYKASFFPYHYISLSHFPSIYTRWCHTNLGTPYIVGIENLSFYLLDKVSTTICKCSLFSISLTVIQKSPCPACVPAIFKIPLFSDTSLNEFVCSKL